jgi:hypothetical protein
MPTQGQKIVGFGLNRKGEDFYPTRRYVTVSLLERETFSDPILEPCCGDGAIAKVLEQRNYSCLAYDLNPRGYGIKQDFFSYKERIDSIITNPPFKLAEQFLIHSKKVATSKIAFLLKTVFLEGKNRYELFQDRRFPLKCIYQFAKRISFDPMQTSGMLAFAWFVWDKAWTGEPMIRWINR